MATIRYQKRGHQFYVYEVTQYWDKELKKPRQKTRYLGCAVEKGGAYAKTGRRAAEVQQESAILDFGDSFAIHETARQMGLTTLIEDSFGDCADSLQALMCYQMTEGAAMQHCEDWMDGNIAKVLFPKAKVSSQDISRLLRFCGKEEIQQSFFRNYIARFFQGTTGLLIDSTALPSSINASLNAFGYGSGGVQEHVSCLMLVEKKSHLPIYFRAIGGDIADNSTLQTTLREISQLGLKAESAVLDAGYCSKENLRSLCAAEIDFVTRLPRSHSIFYNLVDEVLEGIESCAHAIEYGERVLFSRSVERDIYGNTLFAHVILDPHKKSHEATIILKNTMGVTRAEKEEADLNAKLRYAGFFVLLSRKAILSSEIMPTYYTRQAIEQIFGFAKCNGNLLPLRVHSSESIRGTLMLVFLALIVFVTMRKKLQPKLTVDLALLRLRGLKAKIFPTQILIQEPNKKVKDIAKLLSTIMPISLGI